MWMRFMPLELRMAEPHVKATQVIAKEQPALFMLHG
jgi:hypothetical protein